MTVISPVSGAKLSQRGRVSDYLPLDITKVYASNEATGVSADEFFNVCWVLQYHARYQLGRAWPIPLVSVVQLPAGRPVPRGGVALHFTDTLDVAGALGYHDEDGNEVPYARIGVQTSKQDNVAYSAVGAHELDELLVDLHVDLTAINERALQVVAFEVGDPCQGNDYDVGEPEGRPTGVQVADFALPSWFDQNTPPATGTSYRGALKGPFTVGPEGYHAYVDLRDPVTPGGRVNWQQAFGQDHVNHGDPSVTDPE